jgi:hypothetical protein
MLGVENCSFRDGLRICCLELSEGEVMRREREGTHCIYLNLTAEILGGFDKVIAGLFVCVGECETGHADVCWAAGVC